MTNATRNIGLAALVVSTLHGVAHGQTQDGFTNIAVKIGDTVTVLSPGGTHVTGRVSEVTPTLLTVNGQKGEPDRALQIDRLGDPLFNGIRNGALIGFAFFTYTFPGALTMNAALDRDCVVDEKFGCKAAMVAASAAVGALWDWWRVGRTTVFADGAVRETRLTVAPMGGPGHVGMRGTIVWRW